MNFCRQRRINELSHFWLEKIGTWVKAAETLKIKPEQVDVTNMNAFYVLHASYIDASLDEAVKKYGSMGNYIRDGLGITDKELSDLREHLLDPI